MTKRIEMVGQTFGRWTVLSSLPRKGGQLHWFCRCECGTERPVMGIHLRSGRSTSCGCYLNDIRGKAQVTHGKTGTPEYSTWCRMITRCEAPNNPEYSRYGGRGIKICDHWRESFAAFLDDMGERPSDAHSIDRIDVNGDYEPANCRWATDKEQSRNTRRNRYLVVRGERMTLAEAVERFGGKYATVKWRLEQGQTAEEALGLT